MSCVIPSTLLEKLREYRVDLYSSGQARNVPEIRAALAAIPDENIRRGALDRFHVLMVCAAVMKVDPLNYSRAISKAHQNLISFLVEAEKGAKPRESLPEFRPAREPAHGSRMASR